jgi:hypothetical protein
MLAVGRLACGPHRDKSEHAGDHVEDGVDRLAQDAKASGQQTHDELAQDQGDPDEDGDQSNKLRPAAEGFH